METKDFQLLKKSFDQDGYVYIPNFLSEYEVDQVNQRLEHFIEEVVPNMPRKDVFYEDDGDNSTLKQLINMSVYDPFFQELLEGGKFEKIAEFLLEEKVIGKNIEYFNKPPKIGKPTPPHQDNHYFMLKPARAVTMWLALEEVDLENGCLHYIRGSHLHGPRPHGRTNTIGFSQGILDFGKKKDLANEVALPAKPGDLLVHHAMTIHRADGNKSSRRSRRAMGLLYFGVSAREDKVSKEAYLKALSE